MRSVILFLSVLITGFGVLQQSELPIGNYVVVGAYSVNQEYYAKAYTEKLNDQGLSASYGLSRSKNLFFVYLSQNQNFDQAISEMRKTRENEQFSDAWVFVNKVGPEVATTQSTSDSEEETDANTSTDEENMSDNSDANTESLEANPAEESSDNNVTEEETTAEATPEESEETENVEEVKEITELSQIGFKVNLYNAQTGGDVNGSVQLVDTERAKQHKKFKSGEVVKVKDPDNGTGKMSVIIDNFGFRKQQKEINFFNPLSDTARVDLRFEEDVLELNFDLIRYSVGDFVVMYNVAFFKDAAVMRPESKFEVNSLITMMQENSDLKIRIHGHVNGKHPGKVISKGGEPDYYKLSDLNKEGVGSAKELSKKRAELIRDLLMENGVIEGRMEIKAWGGKRMIHDKNSTRADENVRVEIEILED
ncbi:MAG: OmpA family protein [Bacteroidota bacterium]